MHFYHDTAKTTLYWKKFRKRSFAGRDMFHNSGKAST